MQEGWKIAIGVLSVLAIIVAIINYFHFGKIFLSPIDTLTYSSWPLVLFIFTLVALTAAIVIYNLIKLKKIELYVL
jgi:hypothetical protein